MKNNQKIDIMLKDEYLQELKKKHNTVTLSKLLNSDTAQKLLKGEANITVRNLCKLCIDMEWPLPEFLEIKQD